MLNCRHNFFCVVLLYRFKLCSNIDYVIIKIYHMQNQVILHHNWSEINASKWSTIYNGCKIKQICSKFSDNKMHFGFSQCILDPVTVFILILFKPQKALLR